MKVRSIVGTQPNFMKIVPIISGLNNIGIENILAGTDKNDIISVFKKVTDSDNKLSKVPPLWDGKTRSHSCQIIANYLNS